MTSNIDTSKGGGPWEIPVPALEPGEAKEFRLKTMTFRGQKGYFVPWLPLDSATFKNRDPDASVRITFNGQFDTTVLPNQSDSFTEVGIQNIRVENIGSVKIEEENFLLSVSKDAFDADDAALTEAQRSPVEKMVRGVLGL